MHKLLVLAFGLMLVPLATAQAQTHSLTGTVTDQNGDPVAGADVYVYQYGSPEEPTPAGDEKIAASDYYHTQAVTDAQGRYTVQVRSGYADISVQKDGYAGAYRGVEVSGPQTVDLTMQKYPDRTAQVSGQILANGKPLPWASLSIENPQYGLYACSTYAADAAAGSGSSGSEPAQPGNSSTAIARPYYDNGCQITINEDGSFSGAVWPGYSILRAYHDDWRACPDGGCQQYYGFVEVMVLQDGANEFDIRLKARPAPDATVLGYVLDEDGQPVKGVYVSFSNQDTYSWGQAMTDGDGSFKAALRSGVVEISVWADGYFPYYESLDVETGENRLVVRLTEGDARYGGCCYALDASAETKAGAPMSAGADSDGAGAGQEGGVTDLQGGLGKYDPSFENADKESPGLGLVSLLALLAMVLISRRK